MSGFPPNLEDGELWLPSDVFHEIQSTNTHHENRSNYALNIAHSHPVQAVVGPRTSAASSFPNIAINFKESRLRNLRGWACFPGSHVDRGLMNIPTWKYRGTGVFIPKPTKPRKESDVKMNKGGRIRPSYQGNGMTKKENLRKQVPESPLISTHFIHLPGDWTYEIY
ncbi:hypothetical protein NL676_037445 [Syzygium grande]|nr:hypothetical protein NL676_037445 [Syzygium grande]